MASNPVGSFALNHPASPVKMNPALPVITIPPGASSAYPGGATVQPSSTYPGGYWHVNMPNNALGSNAYNALPGAEYQPANKYPYVTSGVTHQYDIVVTRATYTIAGTLPFMIGAFDEFLNNFSDFLGQVSGTASSAATCSTGSGANSGSLAFSYTVASNTDIIYISCPQTPYTRLVKELETKRYKVIQARVALSDTTNQSQFSTPLKVGWIGDDSEVIVKPLSYTANQSPYQYESFKIDVGRDMYLSRSEGILSSIVNDSENNFAVTFSLFISESAPTFTPRGQTTQTMQLAPNTSNAVAAAVPTLAAGGIVGAMANIAS